MTPQQIGLIQASSEKAALIAGPAADFTPEAKAAWTESYAALAAVMTSA